MSGKCFHSIKLCWLPLMVCHHRPEILSTHRRAFHSHPHSPVQSLSDKQEPSGLFQGPVEGTEDKKGSYCDLFLLGTEGFLKVLMLLEKRFHAVQGVPQVLVQQESLQQQTRCSEQRPVPSVLRQESKGTLAKIHKEGKQLLANKLLRSVPESPEPFQIDPTTA